MGLLDAPLAFAPVYKPVIWGGRRLERWRPALPPGKIGEAWDLADHDAGMSVVASGPLAGESLRALVARFGGDLVGAGFGGGPFPLMVKLIDASDRLSVQVHPDDALARALGVGTNGKTECWLALEDGGELWCGTRPGVDRASFQRALDAGEVETTLARHEVRAGDCFFLAARTVHALGAGCLVYELQQTSDVTFRVYDWGRTGADGRPRPLHVAEALATIDFAAPAAGPRRPPLRGDEGVRRRLVAECAYFRLDELELEGPGRHPLHRPGSCAIVTCLEGSGVLRTPGGTLPLSPSRTLLVPAAAPLAEVAAERGLIRFLQATPRF